MVMAQRPEDKTIWQAIEMYLQHAYEDSKQPASVQSRLDVLRSACGSILSSRAFETKSERDGKRFSVRLGNQYFPHMKLVLECRPGDEWFFRADAHDADCRPPDGSKELEAYRALVSKNRAITSAIEKEWADQGLPTFKTFLRKDLARRSKSAT